MAKVKVNENTMTMAMAKGVKAWVKENPFDEKELFEKIRFLYAGSSLTVIELLKVEDVVVGLDLSNNYCYNAHAYAIACDKETLDLVFLSGYVDNHGANMTEYRK